MEELIRFRKLNLHSYKVYFDDVLIGVVIRYYGHGWRFVTEDFESPLCAPTRKLAVVQWPGFKELSL